MIFEGAFVEGEAFISPDGRWIVYQSNESGRMEVYLRPFPDVSSGRWQISNGGGVSPRWMPDGRSIAYRAAPDFERTMKVPIETDPALRVGTAELLFEAEIKLTAGVGWDVHPDGERFLMIREDGGDDDQVVPEVVLIQNWDVELQRLVPHP
jgi:serine/threonine-protein kinase